MPRLCSGSSPPQGQKADVGYYVAKSFISNLPGRNNRDYLPSLTLRRFCRLLQEPSPVYAGALPIVVHMAFALPATYASAASTLHGSNLRCPAARRPAPAAQPLRVPVEMKKARFHQPMIPRRPDDPFKVPEDGTPIFAIFVRSPVTRIWYPLGAVPGDKRSKTLVDTLKTSWGKAIYQNTLDKGIAQTVFGKDRSRLLGTALRQYPQLKKHERDLEFGYKISAAGLKDFPTRVVSPDLALPFFQWAKQQFSNAFSSIGKSK